jgi:hypothetical protein
MRVLGQTFTKKFMQGAFQVKFPDRAMSSRILIEEMGGPYGLMNAL